MATLQSRKSARITISIAALLSMALTGCTTLQTGGAQAVIDASRPHVGPCAGALTGEAMPRAREACLPLLVILDGA